MGLRKPPSGQAVDDFIDGAGAASKSDSAAKVKPAKKKTPSKRAAPASEAAPLEPSPVFPWESDQFSVERHVYVNLILDEVAHQKLKYVASNGPYNSANDFMRKLLLPALEKEIQKIEKMKEIFADMD